MSIAETGKTFVVKEYMFRHVSYFSLKCFPKILQPRYFTIFLEIFDTPIKRGQNIWYPSKNSSTPEPSFKNDSSLKESLEKRMIFLRAFCSVWLRIFPNKWRHFLQRDSATLIAMLASAAVCAGGQLHHPLDLFHKEYH